MKRGKKKSKRKWQKKSLQKGEMKKYRKVFKLKYDQNGYLVAYQRNSRYIKEEIRNLGFFFIITSEDMSASKALDIYRGRDNIEDVQKFEERNRFQQGTCTHNGIIEIKSICNIYRNDHKK